MELALDLSLIRALETPELRLYPGRSLMARVVREHGPERGALSIAGVVIEAELPRHLRAGDEVRLTVRHATAQRLVLELARDQPPHPPAAPAVPLPGGGDVRVEEHEHSAAATAGELHTLRISYDAPALGPITFGFELDRSGLRLTVATAAGTALALAQGATSQLRDALTEQLDRPVSIRVVPRREPLDVYA